jgi:MscS family membrane protein
METLYPQLAIRLSDWFLALCALAGTLVLVPTAHHIFKKFHQDRYWPILRQLAPSISKLIFVLGLRLVADLAPLSGHLEAWVDHGIYVFSILICLQLSLRAALIAIEWPGIQSHRSEALNAGFIPLIRNVITLFVFFTGGIMILKHFNYDVLSLITALGVGSLAVGLAAKDTLSNMISGFILIIDRNLSPGDRINLAGTVGDVSKIGLRSTQLRLSDGNTLIVPNSELVNTRLMNLSLPNRKITCSVVLKVPYSVSFPRVKELCLAVLKQDGRVSSEHACSVNLSKLSEGYQLVQIGFWVKDLNEAGATVSDFNEKILSAFKQDGIPLISALLPAFQPVS